MTELKKRYEKHSKKKAKVKIVVFNDKKTSAYGDMQEHYFYTNAFVKELQESHAILEAQLSIARERLDWYDCKDNTDVFRCAFCNQRVKHVQPSFEMPKHIGGFLEPQPLESGSMIERGILGKGTKETLADSLQQEITRVKELAQNYRDPILEGAGNISATLMERDIGLAELAIMQGDFVGIINAHKELQGWESE